MVGRNLPAASVTDLLIFLIQPVSSLNSSESLVMISAILPLSLDQTFLQYVLDIAFPVEEFPAYIGIGYQSPVPVVLQASFGYTESKAYILRIQSFLV